VFVALLYFLGGIVADRALRAQQEHCWYVLARCHRGSRGLKRQLAYNLEYWPDKVCIFFFSLKS